MGIVTIVVQRGVSMSICDYILMSYCSSKANIDELPWYLESSCNILGTLSNFLVIWSKLDLSLSPRLYSEGQKIWQIRQTGRDNIANVPVNPFSKVQILETRLSKIVNT